MTTGEILKSELGLDKYTEIKIIKFVKFPLNMYMIFYYSRNLNYPLTRVIIDRCLRTKYTTLFCGWNISKPPVYFPPQDLVEFDRTVSNNMLFIVTDLSGVFLTKQNESVEKDIDVKFYKLIDNKISETNNFYSNEKKESSYNVDKLLEYFKGKLSILQEAEGFQIDDLLQNAESQRNKKFYGLRKSEGETGSFLKSATYNVNKNTLLLTFWITPTYSKIVRAFTTSGQEIKTDHYVVKLQFEDIDYNIGKKGELFDLDYKDQQQFIYSLINEGTIKFWASDPSFIFQGLWENADKLGFSIFPYTGIKGKGIWSKRHMGEFPAIYLTKHLIEVLEIVKQKFIVSDILKLLKKSIGEKK